MSLLLAKKLLIPAADTGTGTAFAQMFSTPVDIADGAEADPWDATVSIPSGDNRILLLYILWQGNAPLSVVLDPGGLDQALTQVFSDAQGGETIALYVLLEADMPAAGSYTLRVDWDSARDGARQIICLRGASQTITSGHNSSASSGAAITATATRASGDFPTGSLAYAWARGSGVVTFTVTDDVTEVAERNPGTGSANDSGVYAEGTLDGSAGTAAITATASGSVTRRVAGIVVVEPASDDPWGRDSFWTSDGYTKAFYSTPAASDIGTDVQTWFAGPWANGQSLSQNSVAEGSVVTDIAAAPDGSPSVRTVLPAATSDQSVFVRGTQLGSTGSGMHAVFAVEVWVEDYGPNGTLGCYQGVGHHWGSVDGVTHAPGGSTNFGDAWSMRCVKSISDNWAIYKYNEENTGSGSSSPQSSVKGANGAWQLIELEVIQNDPHTSSNGVLRMYRNGTLITEITSYKIRQNAATRPKGLGYFVQHNDGGAEIETFYHRNWKIYTKG